MATKETTINFSITTPKAFIAHIKGIGGLLINKAPDMSKPKSDNENQAKVDKAEEERLNWREKLYCDAKGNIFLPGENAHQCLKDAATYWKQKIPGEGNATYTNLFDKAIVVEDYYPGMHKDDDRIIPFGKMANGIPGRGKKSGCKVYKIRPMLQPWEAKFKIHIFDQRITSNILRIVLQYAGTYIGFGDWRPTYGRFELVSLDEVTNG